MQAPAIIVIGPPHHGKTEARKILSELTFSKGESTSTAIYSFLAHRSKTPLADLQKIPKEDFRAQLIEAGDFLVGAIDKILLPAVDETIDASVYRVPSTLVRTLYMAGYNVIDGVRRKAELQDAIKHLEWNGVRTVVIWIERPGGDQISDNTELTSADATDIVINDGTLDDLRAKLKDVLERHFGKQPDKPDKIQIFDNDGEPVAQD